MCRESEAYRSFAREQVIGLSHSATTRGARVDGRLFIVYSFCLAVDEGKEEERRFWRSDIKV